MKSTTLTIILLTLLLQAGCRKGIFADAGKMVTVERKALPFNRISLYDNVDLILTQDTAERIKVEAGENLQSSIITSVEGNTLTIKNEANSLINKPNEKIKVHVSVRQLQNLNYQSSGNVTCTNTLYTSYIDIVSNLGAGNVSLRLDAARVVAGIYEENTDFIFSGRAVSCYTYCAPKGTIDFRNFEVKNMELDYSSVRDAYINVTDSIKGTIYHKGNVYYKGLPALQTKVLSEGRFISY